MKAIKLLIAVCLIVSLSGCVTLEKLRDSMTVLRQVMKEIEISGSAGIDFPELPEREEEVEEIEETDISVAEEVAITTPGF